MKIRFFALFLFIVSGLIGYFFALPSAKTPFKLGLDLAGGTHLVYNADISKLNEKDVVDSMNSLRDVIERRTNLFGVSEPVVQVEKSGDHQRLIVELPGVTDINKAIKMIGQTPMLEFKIERPGTETRDILRAIAEVQEDPTKTNPLALNDPYADSGLTGRYLEKAQLQFNPQTNEPVVSISFNSEGKDKFAKLTKENIGKTVAIYLDGSPITTPVVREEIRDGKAEISGGFTPQEAKTLVRDLNYGALPVPINLVSTQSVGASLGENVLNKGVKAGVWGMLAVIVFLIIWYRIPGLLASISLLSYISIMLALFKFIPVTLTSAGIAGFIMTIGMAVDANVLVFERMKEELKTGKDVVTAIKDGFSRAWLSIRDSNVSSIITAIILFWFGTSLVKGFALVFGMGVLVSMFTAIVVTRTLLLAVAPKKSNFLFSCGIGE